MTQPIGPQDPIRLPGEPEFPAQGPLTPAKALEESNFKSTLLDSLDEVSRLQKEAGQSVERLMTGESSDVAEVFVAARKADVAFSMLMEMRNKLLEAYRELQQMRV